MPKQRELFAQITALLVAQDAFEDNRGRTHIIGVFDSIGAPKFPVNISFMVYCAIKGAGKHTVVIKVEAPGLYRLIAFLDGIKEIEHPLFVREEAAPPKLGPSGP